MKKLTIEIPEELHKKIKDEAFENNESMKNFIVDSLQKKLNSEEERDEAMDYIRGSVKDMLLSYLKYVTKKIENEEDLVYTWQEIKGQLEQEARKMQKPIIIAIDGPSASGKGTLAKKLANHLKFPHLDTGLLYRLAAFRIIERRIELSSFEDHIKEITQDIDESSLANPQLPTEEVGVVASIIARSKKFRQAIFDFQTHFVNDSKEKHGGVVLDGRDTTTVICPDADFKFYVEADVQIRAIRRYEQLKAKGDEVSLDEILLSLKKRDESDKNRDQSPLKIAKNAHIIDNGQLSIDEGLKMALEIINR